MPRPNCSYVKRGLAIALLTALSLVPVVSAQQHSVQTRAFQSRPEEEMLLVAVRMGRELLADTIVAYPLEGSIILPLGELARLLEFGIEVDVASRTASGFFIREDRAFALDVDRQQVLVDGVASSFDADQVEVHQEDIYVDAALLSRWFPIDLNVNLFGALVTLTPREPLPFQLRAEREKKIAAGLAAMAMGPEYPTAEHPYSLFGGPFVDSSLVFERRPQVGGETFEQFRQTTYLAADLFWGEATAFVTGTDDDPAAESRFSWGRRDPAARLLGPLRATEAVIGDSSFPAIDLVARSASGAGFLLTNYPLTRLTQFDSHTFRGELPPGWDVELYRNGSLVDYQRSRLDGLYEFSEVPVLFGLNVFRLVFYGPYGEKREESQVFNVGEDLTPRGEFRYRLSHADPRGLSNRSVAQFEYGIADRASAEVSLLQVGDDGAERRYAKASLNAARRTWLMQMDAIREEGGGSVLALGASTRMGNLNLAARFAAVDDFRSEDLFGRFGPIESRAELRLTGVLGTASRFQLPITLEVERDGLERGGAAYTVRNTLSTYVNRTSVTNRLEGTWFERADPAFSPFAQGSLLVSRWLGGESIRGEVLYQIEPDFRASMVQATVDTRRFEGYLLGFGASHDLVGDDTAWFVGASKTVGTFGVNLNLNYSDEGMGVRALVNFGMGRDSISNRWFTKARSLAGAGAASVLVFLDEDGDGIKGPDEAPLEGVTFFINRSSSPVETDESGRALFSGLVPYGFTNLAISTSSLEDPYLVPAHAGFRFVPRPGSVMNFLFPVRMTGEIAGTVYMTRGDELREAPGVELELLAADGTIAHSVRTQYDGYYNIAMVMPGSYTLRVSPAQLDRIAMQADPVAVVIGPEGSVRDGVNLKLSPTQ